MERLVSFSTLTPKCSATAQRDLDHSGLALSFGFGILVFWSATGMILDYVIGENPIVRLGGKMVLAAVVLCAVPVFAAIAVLSTVAGPVARLTTGLTSATAY